MDEVVELRLDALHAHRRNSNVMPDDRFRKLVAHIGATGRYPPIIVRRRPSPGRGRARSLTHGYEILDGHHRALALGKLGRACARCVVWDVDDDEALVLLATLNRLQGEDDARKRGALLAELIERGEQGAAALSAKVPESPGQMRRLLAAAGPPPAPRPPQPLEDMPVAVHFFLPPAQRRELETRLRALGGEREAALMELVRCAGEPAHAGKLPWAGPAKGAKDPVRRPLNLERQV